MEGGGRAIRDRGAIIFKLLLLLLGKFGFCVPGTSSSNDVDCCVSSRKDNSSCSVIIAVEDRWPLWLLLLDTLDVPVDREGARPAKLVKGVESENIPPRAAVLDEEDVAGPTTLL